MNPIKPLISPVAEVRKMANIQHDEFGEAWVVIDGIETKVPSIAAAKALLVKQDAVRVKIREDLDAVGLRFNSDGTDREEPTEIVLEDGTVTTVGLMKPGDANYLQMETFPDAGGLFKNAERAQIEAQKQAAIAAAAAAKKIKPNKPWYKRLPWRRKDA